MDHLVQNSDCFTTATPCPADDSAIDVEGQTSEFTLEDYRAYEIFQRMIELKLQHFLDAEELDAADLKLACETASVFSPKVHTFVQAVIASWEFPRFAQLVTAFRAEAADEDEQQEAADAI